MKAAVKGIISNEKGYILIAALILLVIGGLILTPLLGLMSTGLLAGKVYEKKMHEYYAADAGIEDALWKIQHNIEIPPDGYNLMVNDKYVWVEVESTDAAEFLADLLDVDPGVHSDWMITYGNPSQGIFSINITWNGTAENKKIYSVGAWLGGSYSYLVGQDIPDDDIRAQYPNHTFEQKAYEAGTVFIWEWTSSNRPVFNQGDTITLTFQFTPQDIPPMSIGWVRAGSSDVGLSYGGNFGLHTITATAVSYTGTATANIDSQTIVVAHAAPRGCEGDEIEVLNWNIN
jgi:hypothetical protein